MGSGNRASAGDQQRVLRGVQGVIELPSMGLPQPGCFPPAKVPDPHGMACFWVQELLLHWSVIFMILSKSFILFLLFTVCMTSDKFLNLSEFKFLIYKVFLKMLPES